ncbi:MAG: Ldh family oxidoreductase [Candidatus Latescibacteria bacterium]|nr:Ldh family oxidoreductase [Candidatus Latescibacterota bacterium]
MKLYLRNYPPPAGIRVPPAPMRALVADLFVRAGHEPEGSSLLAELLVQNDLRCVFSHGTRKLPDYLPLLRQGGINARPQVRVVEESPTTAVLDGDGGLGYFPCHQGARLAAAKAAEHGVGAVTTRNHFHFGAAGIYSRLALDRDCIGLAISANRFDLSPEALVLNAVSVSPLSLAVPAGNEAPLVLDMGAGLLPYSPELFSRFPATFFKSLGLGAVFMALGGVLAGIWRPECQHHPAGWLSDQGAFIAAFAVDRFMEVGEFKREMDRYIGQARAMRPLPGTETAELPGGLEWTWERQNSTLGIPYSDEHCRLIEQVAEEFGAETPFPHWQHTRFGPTP